MTDEKLLTVKQVADRFQLSENTVIKAINGKRLRALRIEKQYRIPESSIDFWVQDTGRSESGQGEAPA